MKNLNLISFVGVDTNTNLNELFEFNLKSRECNFNCEFGVLYSQSQKSKRYPDYAFCFSFLRSVKIADMNTSIHLCGSESIDKFLLEDPPVIELCKMANRTQLNINIKNYPDYDLLAKNILSVSTKHNITCILQENATKKKFNEVLINYALNNSNIHFLNDSSGGFGREITKVNKPNSNNFTGYAGGINPDNVKRIVNLIESVNIDNIPYYIDIESGIRVDNNFSIDKCDEIIINLK